MKFNTSKTNIILALMILNFFLSGIFNTNTNAAPVEIKEINASGLELSVWVEDSKVLANQSVKIYFDIYNAESFSISLNMILIFIDSEVYPIDDNYILYNYSTYSSFFPHTFKTIGSHNITLEVDSSIGFFESYLVVEVEKNEFILNVFQDYYAKPGQEVTMELEITSTFEYSQQIYIEVFADYYTPNGTYMYRENIYADYWFYIDANTTNIVNIDNTFWNEGYYDLEFIITDEHNETWFEYGYFEIYNEKFEIFIYQDYYAKPGQEVTMELEIKSKFNLSIFIDIEVFANYYTTNGTFVNSFYIYTDYNFWLTTNTTNNVSIYYTFWNEGHYDLEFIITDNHNETCSEYGYLDIYNEKFEIFVYQDYEAKLGEVVCMKLEIKSKFTHSMFIDIEVFTDYYDPNGTYIDSFYIYTESNFWINANTKENISINYTFWDEGHYDLEFHVIDDLNVTWSESCYWDIYYIAVEDLNIWVEHNTKINIYDNFHLDLFIDSYFDFDIFVTIKVTANYSIDSIDQYISIYENTNFIIIANSITIIPIDYTFDLPNHYELEFEVSQQSENRSWYTYSQMDILGEDEHLFEMWIENENYVMYNETTFAYIYVNSYYDIGYMIDRIYLDLIRYDELGNEHSERIFEEIDGYIEANGQLCFEVPISVSALGYYDVELFFYSSTGVKLFIHSWYEFYYPEDGWLIHIKQDNEIYIIEQEDTFISFKNLYSYTKEVNLYLIIEEWVGDNLIDNHTIWEELNVLVNSYGEYYFVIDYYFDHAGNYKVIFVLEEVDTNNTFKEYDWWNVYEKIELWVDYQYNIKVHEEAYMELHLINNVNYWIFIDVEVCAKLIEFGNVIEEISNFSRSEIILDPFSETIINIWYSFDKIGHWELEFEVIEKEEYNYWYTYCYWDVFDDEPIQLIDSKIDIPDRVLVDTTVTVSVEIFNYCNESVEIYSVRIILKLYELDQYSTYNTSVWLSPLTSTSYTFVLNATETGLFFIHVEVDSSIGIYHNEFSFEIIDELNPDTSSDTNSDKDTQIQFTQGFEYFILPLIAIALTLYRKKK